MAKIECISCGTLADSVGAEGICAECTVTEEVGIDTGIYDRVGGPYYRLAMYDSEGQALSEMRFEYTQASLENLLITLDRFLRFPRKETKNIMAYATRIPFGAPEVIFMASIDCKN